MEIQSRIKLQFWNSSLAMAGKKIKKPNLHKYLILKVFLKVRGERNSPILGQSQTQQQFQGTGMSQTNTHWEFYHKNEGIYSRSTNLMVPAIFESHSHEAERTQSRVPCSEHTEAKCHQVSPSATSAVLASIAQIHLFWNIPWTWEAQIRVFSQDQFVVLIKPPAPISFVFHCLKLSPAFGADSDFLME